MTNIYRFTDDCEDKPLLGNKGANLVTMTRLGLRVPPGFVVSIDAFKEYRASNTLPLDEIDEALTWLSDKLGRSFDDGLTVSVRSSAPVSMPGMMDTVLNVASREEVLSCLKTVFGSWDNPRANEYRRLHDISADIGTSAVVQSMVMGNRDEMSGTGVVFSRNPSTGARGLFGEYLPVAQGEDLVSGIRTPQSIDALKNQMPDVYEELEGLSRDLELHFHDMQDVEFTVESGNLFMLQTRSGKRSGQAAVKIAVDMVEDGLLTRNEALLRITPDDIRSLLHNRIQFPERHQAIARGLNAAPGAVSGRVVFDPLEAVSVAKTSGGVILVRPETSPDDIQGIAAAGGVLTSRGGLTSHAAIVTRAMGKPCVCGAEEVTVDLKDESFRVGDIVVRKGDVITVDGSSGSVYQGALALLEAEATPELAKLLSLGRRGQADRRLGQCRHRGRRSPRQEARCRGHWPLPHRAPVHGQAPPRRHPRLYPQRFRGGGRESPGEPPKAPEERLPIALQGSRRHTRHHPPSRPPTPRVPARREGHGRPQA